MKIYKVRVSKRVEKKIIEIKDFIVSINTQASSIEYVVGLYEEIDTLSYMADLIPPLIWSIPSVVRENEKRLLVKKGKLTVFFHTYKSCVMVDDIIPSKLVTKENFKGNK